MQYEKILMVWVRSAQGVVLLQNKQTGLKMSELTFCCLVNKSNKLSYESAHFEFGFNTPEKLHNKLIT